MRLFTAVATLVCAGLLLSACGGANTGSGSSSTTLLSAAEAQAEYESAQADFALPPDASYPVKLPTGGATTFEQGCGVSYAREVWTYAWEHEWLTQRTRDKKRGAQALAVLKDEVPTRGGSFEGPTAEVQRKFWNEHITKAELGDPSGFQYDYSINAPTPSAQ